MKTKQERIVRYTSEQLKATRAAGNDLSDWERAAQIAVPDGSDRDDAIEPAPMDWATTKLPMPRRKLHATPRLDADMLEWFRAQGHGYQTRINAILRSYFEQHRL
jgi:uncharacterized protein (DUF4415 family)